MGRVTEQAPPVAPSRTFERVRIMLGLLVLLTLLGALRSPVEVLSRIMIPRAADPMLGNVAGPEGHAHDGVTTPDRASEREQGTRPPSGDAVPMGRASEPGQSSPGGVWLHEVRGGWRIEPGVEEAAALAVLVGHAWAAALSPDPSVAQDASGRLVERGGTVVVVEAVERPGPLAAVVTLLVAPWGVTDDEAHADAEGGPGIVPVQRILRLGVPVVLSDTGASLAGEPWSLPGPTLGIRPLTSTTLTDPDLLASARRALEGVGIDGGRLVALEATEGWPFIARLAEAGTAEENDGATGDPWLRWHLDRFVIAGLPLQRAAVSNN